MPILRIAYGVLLAMAMPLLPLRLWWRGRKEPLYREAGAERFGFFGTKPAQRVFWIHAVSLGETRAAQPLVKALSARYPGHQILITNMTATGRATARELFPHALHAWLPYDYAFAMRRFIAHFRPQLGIIMETEVWPNLVRACNEARVPLLLANARLSSKSARGYARVGPLARTVFAGLSAVGAQSQEDATRLGALGARAITVTGNLKFDVETPSTVNALVAALRSLIGERQVLLAASTRDGEEALILDALLQHPIAPALLLLVPRHPQRFDEVCELVRARGLSFVRRSAGEQVPPDRNILIGDTMGELAAYYRVCDVAFVGGSLLPFGAQNLIEACAAGAPVLIGPSSFNFAEATEFAIQAGAALRVRDAAAMIEQAHQLLSTPSRRDAMSASGKAFCAEHAGATARTLALCAQLIEPATNDPTNR